VGAVAWMIESQTAKDRLCGAGWTLWSNSNQSTYSSELFGLWGILASLQRIANKYSITYGQVVVACDGLLALHKASAMQLTEPWEAHYDLISAIWNLHQQLPVALIFQHVKGHQDKGQITVLP